MPRQAGPLRTDSSLRESADLARQFLSATRLVVDNQLPGGAARRYDELFTKCVELLGLGKEAPLLYVTRTAQSVSETIVNDSGRPIVIYDQNQRSLNDRLNRFVFEDFPTDLVVRLMLRHTRIALLTGGRVTPAAYAGMLIRNWPPTGKQSAEPPPRASDTRRTATIQQECFAIAHELAHVAISRGHINPHWRDVVADALRSIVGRAPDHKFVSPTPHRDVIDGFAAVLGEERASALMRRLDRRKVSSSAIRALEQRLRDHSEQQPHLREEALCDVVASVITMRVFNAQPTLAAPALMLALSNHTTLAMLRREVVLFSHGETTLEEAVEDSEITFALRGDVMLHVWRELAEQRESPDAIASMARYILLLRGRHDFHVRIVAEATPYLVEHSVRARAHARASADAKTVQEVREDTLAEITLP